MNTPNPLVPQGTKPAGRKSTVRIAVLTIAAVHVALIAGLLVQAGCSKESSKANKTDEYGSVNSLGEQTNTSSETNPVYPSGGFAPAGGAAETNLSNAPLTSSTSSVPPFTSPYTGVPAGTTTVTTTTPFPAPAYSSNAAVAPVTPVSPVSDSAAAPASGSTTEYTIASGDTLGKVASKFHVSLKALQAANPSVDSKRLKVGQKIQIPAATSGASTSSATGAATTEGAAPAAASEGTVYTVKKGDVLARIARAHGTTVKAIQELNHLKSTNLREGQKLKMPARKASTTAAPTSTASAPAGLSAAGN